MPFYPTEWKDFSRALERATEEMIAFEKEIKKLEARSHARNASLVRELKREIRDRERAAGSTLAEMRHTMQVIHQGDLEAEKAKKSLVEAICAWLFPSPRST